MRNIVKLSLIAFFITLFNVASAAENKNLETKFGITEIVKNFYSFDICIPRKEGMIPFITLIYWDGSMNTLAVHPQYREYNQAWFYSNLLYQAYDKTKKITISVDFNWKTGEQIKTEIYSLLDVTKDFKNRDLIISGTQEYLGCSKPNNSRFGEVHFFTKN